MKLMKEKKILAFERPDLLKEWDFEKNTSLPKDYVFGSHKKVWWKCHKCGTVYLKIIVYRTMYGSGCIYCKQRKILCVETGMIFSSRKDAAKWADVTPSSIAQNLKGKTKTAAGYHWEYIDENQ